ncbi:cupin domain-containing protein [Burkholderia sp. Ac-20365]|uniref:cupin domain-containing protein n=1 Tax=Burkholderia sp. Ac-20365 TaxID=2703897 RepID=UPI00197B3A49|nr:cupin domain-containing protein [Burkholderia sp. Ac-20365]
MRLSNILGFNVQGSAFTRLRSSTVVVAASIIGGGALLSIHANRVPTIVGDSIGNGGHAMHSSAAADSADSGAKPRTTVTPLSCQKLPNVPGKSITLARVDFPPNGYTPAHTHPGSVTAFVLKGTLRSQLEGFPVETYTAGQTWFEPPGTVHLFAENASATEPASILATFVADDDCGPLTVLK